ncbi:MAG: AraC family transcriptional regulator [Planctomycetota bacterium]
MPLPIRHVLVRQDQPSLTQVGIATQHFPTYVNPKQRNWFTHDVLYCSLLLSGRVTHHLGSDSYTESSGSLSVVNYGVEHNIVTGTEPVEVFNVYIDTERHALPPIPSELASHLYRLLPVHPRFAHRLNRLTRVTLPDPQRTAGWLHAIQREQSGTDAGSATTMLALTQLFLVDLARAVAAQQSGPSLAVGADDELMEAVRQKLDDHFAQEWFLADLAKETHLSSTHFCRRFARYTGCPPMLYLRNRRLQEVMVKLRNSDQNILDLALACGFSDLAYFNRCFKAAAGCTPSAYRVRFVGTM